MDDSIHLYPNCAHNGVLTRVEKRGPMGAPFQTQTSSFSKATAWEAWIYNHRCCCWRKWKCIVVQKEACYMLCSPICIGDGSHVGTTERGRDGAFCWASNIKAAANNRHRRSVWTRSGSQPREDETSDTFISIKDGRSLGSIAWTIQPPSGSQVPLEQTGWWGGGSPRFPGCYFSLLVHSFVAFVRIKQTFFFFY